MKLTKTDLKHIVKQCLLEIMIEDGSIMREVVGEVLSEMSTHRQQVKTQKTSHVTPQQTNEQRSRRDALLQHKRSQLQQAPTSTPHRGKRDMWDIIAEDTMKTTLREQLASDRKNNMSNWASVVTSEENVDDSPLKHLRAAQQSQQSSPQPQHRRAQPSPISGELYEDTTSARHALMSDDSAPSPAQLARALGGRQGAQDAPRVNTGVPDDLAALGLGNMKWDVDEPPRRQQVGSYDSELARIAAEMNVGQ